MQQSCGNFRGVRSANVKREVIDAQIDIEPKLTDGDPLRMYAYCAVRRSEKGEFLCRDCVGRSPKEVNERISEEDRTNAVYNGKYPVVRIARVRFTED